ncbi:hypothetical protein C8J57DRAFT_1247684 [Mycena rebaudengoi]|nr:hypothetical protein C8J57DRAFT_1247684 [Mycena rebaudengoi]
MIVSAHAGTNAAGQQAPPQAQKLPKPPGLSSVRGCKRTTPTLLLMSALSCHPTHSLALDLPSTPPQKIGPPATPPSTNQSGHRRAWYSVCTSRSRQAHRRRGRKEREEVGDRLLERTDGAECTCCWSLSSRLARGTGGRGANRVLHAGENCARVDALCVVVPWLGKTWDEDEEQCEVPRQPRPCSRDWDAVIDAGGGSYGRCALADADTRKKLSPQLVFGWCGAMSLVEETKPTRKRGNFMEAQIETPPEWLLLNYIREDERGLRALRTRESAVNGSKKQEALGFAEGSSCIVQLSQPAFSILWTSFAVPDSNTP